MATHYQVLGVDPKATDADIRAKFHTIAKQYHPDIITLEPPLPEAEAFWEAAQASYNAIKTPELRDAYDAKLLLLAPKCKECRGTCKTQQRVGWTVQSLQCPRCNGTGKEP